MCAQAMASAEELTQLLQRVAAATEAAVAAASTSRATSGPSGGETSGKGNDWFKILPRPELFGSRNAEDEIKQFRDWAWTMETYLTCVDENYRDELKTIHTHLDRECPMSSMVEATQLRAARLYSLLAGLTRGRAQTLVRSIPDSNGYEAWRQLHASLQPKTKTRGLALLSAITSWPSFNMQHSLQSQLLKLEDAFEEAKRVGSIVADDLKCAILMKCVSGQLKSFLTINVDEDADYSDLRETILKWERSHMRWNQSLVVPDDQGPSPMEVDRVQKGKGKGKGKSDSKGKGKGKNDGKGKNNYSQDYGKGKQNPKGGKAGKSGKGKQEPSGKGKGFSKSNEQRACHYCGKVGHLQKDCWQKGQVRQIDEAPTASSNKSEASDAASQKSQVRRIESVGQGPLIFDLTAIDEYGFEDDFDDEWVQAISFAQHATEYYDISGGISDDESDEFADDFHWYAHSVSGAHANVQVVRAIAEHDRDELVDIVVDSGSDASLLPQCYAGAGTPTKEAGFGGLCDAQGGSISVLGIRNVEFELQDEDGYWPVIKEKVYIGGVSNPLISYGKMLNGDWTIHKDEGRPPLWSSNSGLYERSLFGGQGSRETGEPCESSDCRLVRESQAGQPRSGLAI